MIEIKGYDELVRQIKRLGDSAKKTEILGLQRRVSRPLVTRTKSEAPLETGFLRKSIGFTRGKSRSVIQSWVEPKLKKGGSRKDSGGWRAHFVHGGTDFRQTRKGKRNRGIVKSNPFLKRAFDSLESVLVSNYEKELTNYFQKKIDRLSKK